MREGKELGTENVETDDVSPVRDHEREEDSSVTKRPRHSPPGNNAERSALRTKRVVKRNCESSFKLQAEAERRPVRSRAHWHQAPVKSCRCSKVLVFVRVLRFELPFLKRSV